MRPIDDYDVVLLRQAELFRAADRHRLAAQARRATCARRTAALRDLLTRCASRRLPNTKVVPCPP